MNVIWTKTVGSTNEELKKLALAGAEDGTVYIAAEQSEGRGRKGREFISPAGGVYLSVLLRYADTSGLTCAVAVAVRRVLLCYGIEPEIKWPNDLLLNSRKLCGILTQRVTMGEGGFTIVGVGVNVNQSAADYPPELRERVTSLYMHTGEQFDCRELAEKIAVSIIEMSRSDRGEYINEYTRYCSTIGKKIGGGEHIRGLAVGVEPDGALKIINEAGETEYIRFGEVTLR